MTGIPFYKAHGAGNDFVILDGRVRDITTPTRGQVRALLDRRLGIGGDGLLLIWRAVEKYTASVRYWNSDGSSASFCGNGARCVGELIIGKSPDAQVCLLFGKRSYIVRRAGVGRINLGLPIPRVLRVPCPSPPGIEEFWSQEEHYLEKAEHNHENNDELPSAAWIDSGVPHFIIPVSDLDCVDVAKVAPPIRSWPPLGPAGTNVDLIEEVDGEWRVRTWERGVEGETPACGSGLAAAGFYAGFIMGRPIPVRLRSASGDRFVFDADPAGKRVWLEGPACIVYSGLLRGGYPVAPYRRRR